MKQLKFSITLLFFAILLLNTSCGGDDDDGNGINVGDGCMASWKVNGVDYEIDDLALCIYLDNTLNLGASITGGDLQIQIDPISSSGTYVADPSNQDLSVYVSMILTDGTFIGSQNVTIVVTELSNQKAKGTFSGDFYDLADVTLTPNFSVTDGSFEANF